MTKILLWPRSSLTFFGISEYLKKNIDCEIFGVIDDNHVAKKFFSHQKIVDYKKMFYYNDYINSSFEKHDIKFLTDFEKKYDINIWKMVLTDRVFIEYNKYYNFSYNEILSIFQYGCKFLEGIIEEIKPDILLSDVSAFHQDLILQKICKKKKIKIMIPYRSRFGGLSVISEEVDTIDDIKNYENKETRDYMKELQELSKKYSKEQKILARNFRSSTTKRLKAGLRFLILVNNKQYRKYFSNWGKTPLAVINVEIRTYFAKKIRKKFLDKNALKTINNEKFVYFPLHFEPERSLLFAAPYFVNQLEVITQIAKSLPVGYVLFVKEHPLMKSMGWRPRKFYREILNLPNVKLFHPSVSNEEMVKKSSLIITIAGTAGMDAILNNKPSIVFADTIYSNLSAVTKVKNVEELPNIIKKSLEKKITNDDLDNFLRNIYENSFKEDIQQLEMKILNEFYYGGFTSSTDINEDKMKKFLNANSTIFEKIGNEIIKKIENSN